MLLIALILSFCISGMLYFKTAPKTRRLRFSFYLSIIQVVTGSITVLVTSLHATSPVSCIAGGVGVYINPIITLIDLISLLSLSRSKLRAGDKVQFAIFGAFIAARLTTHVLAGAAYYWSFSFCTV